jgi:tetratricopeptide (TPR) repeat protein
MRSRPLALALAAVAALALSACSKDPNVAKKESLDSGNKLLDQGKPKEAIVEYRKAIQQDPRYGEARLKLSEAYAKDDNLKDAYREAIRAADLLPDDVGAQVRAARFLLLAGQFEDAKTRAEKALEKAPASIDAQLARANATAGLKDLDTAVTQVEQAIALDPKQAVPYANLGALEMARGKPQEAEAAYRKAVEAAPGSVPAQLALANFYWASGRREDAEAGLKAALQLDPKHASANRALATFYMASGRAPEAEQYLKAVADEARDAGPRLSLADYYIRAGRGADAERVLVAAAAMPDGYVPAQARIAALRFAEGKKDEAFKTIDEVLRKHPKDPLALLVNARFLAADGRLEEALAKGREAIAADPNLVEAHYFVGNLHLARHEDEEAVASFTTVIQLNPRAAAAHLQLARVELRRGGAQASVKAAREAVTASGGNPTAQLMLVQAQAAAGELAAAETGMAPLLARFPDVATVQSQSGAIALAKGDVRSARLAFAKALELDPLSGQALAGLVAADVKEGKSAQALARVQERLRVTPDDTSVLMLGAHLDASSRDFAGAETLLRRAVEADPQLFEAYEMLGRLFIAQRKLDKALYEFETLAKRRPKSVGAQTMVGMLLQAMGRPEEAQQRYEQVIAMDPTAAVAANNLAWIYAQQEPTLDRALELAQAAKVQLPSVANVSDTLGYIYSRKGLFASAVPAYEAAVQLAPDKADYHFRLGMACVKTGEWDKAKRALTRALELDPDMEGAPEARRTLAKIGN